MLKTKRFLFYTMLILLILNFSGSGYTFFKLYSHEQHQLQTAIDKQQSLLKNTNYLLDSHIGMITKFANNYAESLTKNKSTITKLSSEITKDKKLTREILGISIVYVPNNQNSSLPSLYWKNINNTFRPSSIKFDYNGNSENAWFIRSFTKPGPHWSNPYYDNLLKQFAVSYSLPIFDNGNHNKVVAILIVEIDMQPFDDIVSQNLGEKFTTIINKKGFYLYNEDTEKIINKVNINDKNDSHRIQLNTEIFSKINTENCKQNCVIQSKSDGLEYMFLYQKLNNAPWIVLAKYNKKQLISLVRTSNNKLTMMNIGFTTGAIICSIFLLGFYRLRPRYLVRTMWKYSVLISITLILGTVYTWQKSSSLYYRDTSGAIRDITTLNTYLAQYKNASKIKNTQALIEIPTSITIDSIEFLNSYNIQITGHVMQRFPIGENIEAGIKFNNNYYSQLKLISEIETNQYKAKTWSFEVRVREAFDYTHHPFNHGSVWLAISPSTQQSNIVLVPDFSYYNGLTDINFANGINKNIIIPGWYVKGSYFTYIDDSSRMFNKIDPYQTINLPALAFNVIIGSTFSDAIITTIIPPVVIILILFITLLTVSKRKNKFIEFKVTSILGSSSGLLFTIVFTHVSLRNKLTSEIMYIEYFYLLMYFVVLLIPVNAFLFASHKFPRLNTGNNILIKTSYFPLITLYLFLVSLWQFS